MLNLQGVCKTYIPQKGKPVYALKNIDLSFDETGLVFLLGKSGSGKSTLMNIIGGLDHPDSGSIHFYDQVITQFDRNDYDAYRNTMIGFIFQEFNLIESYSVYQNIALSASLQNEIASRRDIETLLETLELSEEIDRMPFELSGGQKQRVSIARALIKDPRVLLADEPTGSLDSETGKQIFELLKTVSKNRLVIVVSHDRDFALTYGDRIIEMSDGRVIQDSKPTLPIIDPKPIHLKKPKMRLLDALGMGFQVLIKRPVRLTITLLLLIFTFTLFSALDSVTNYNLETVAMQHAHRYDETMTTVVRVENDPFKNIPALRNISQSQLDALQSKYPNRYMIPVISHKDDLETIYQLSVHESYYPTESSGVVVIDNTFLQETQYTLKGRLPQNASEVVIPLHFVDTYRHYGYDAGQKVEILTADDMIGKFIDTDQTIEIVGILDTHFNDKRYQQIYDENTKVEVAHSLGIELDAINDNSPHTYLYVHASKAAALMDTVSTMSFDYSTIAAYKGVKGDLESMDKPFAEFARVTTIRKAQTIPNNAILNPNFNQTSLIHNQVLLSIEQLRQFEFQRINPNYNALVEQRFKDLIQAFADEHYEANQDALLTLDGIDTKAAFIAAMKTIKYFQTFQQQFLYTYYSQAELDVATTILFQSTEWTRLKLSLDKGHIRAGISNVYEVEIVGLVPGYDTWVSDDFYQNIQTTMSVYPYSSVLISLSNNAAKDAAFLQNLKTPSDTYTLQNEIEYMMINNNNGFVLAKRTFVWFSLSFALFSGILFYKFISNSIIHKKKDIGILRALGGSRRDVMKIFLTETLSMAVIVICMSFLSSMVLVHYFDQFVTSFYGLEVSLIWVEWKQFLRLGLLATVVSLVSTYLPIYRYSNQKPVDVIRISES